MIYSGTIVSKNGDSVPVFTDGKPMHSKYRPTGESSGLSEECRDGFIVCAGIGGAFHIETLLSSLHGDFFVLAVEADRESLDFSLSIPRVRRIFDSCNADCCTVDELESKLSELYLPVAYPSFSFVAHRAWESHVPETCRRIRDFLESKLAEFSSDFSVQSHFGKIWQRNIIENAIHSGRFLLPPVQDGKTAAVIAAGPSLDVSIGEIMARRDSFVVFSTDTAYGALVSRGIEPEYVVSIDGQFVSSSHFLPAGDAVGKSTAFVFDMCANPTAVRMLRERGFKVLLSKSRHPLCSFIPDDALPVLESGSGTVTIAACDLARLLGAKTIRVFGADFAYSGGKPYCRGTYLDAGFMKSATRLSNPETAHSSLMFRTEHESCEGTNVFGDALENPKSSSVLCGYRKTLLEWAERHGYSLEGHAFVNMRNSPDLKFSGKTSDSGEIESPEHNGCYVKSRGMDEGSSDGPYPFISPSESNYGIKIAQWMASISPIFKESAQLVQASVLKENTDLYPFFPYAAWLRKSLGNNKTSFFELLKLAYTQLSRYTDSYEK
ncbi:MAG: DUF115 domain-containing protein [Treponema sp.]|nr:DUF115 domain-containing protein [Treponema sp.]